MFDPFTDDSFIDVIIHMAIIGLWPFLIGIGVFGMIAKGIAAIPEFVASLLEKHLSGNKVKEENELDETIERILETQRRKENDN